MGAGAVIGLGASWTGVGAVVGVAAVVHGADGVSAALQQLWTGQDTKTLTSTGIAEGLKASGVDADKANAIAEIADAGVGLALSAGMAGSNAITAVSKVAAKGSTQGFNSFSAFKRAMGPAGQGQAWHHIVEQTPGNLAKFGNQTIHNTGNLMKLPHGAGSIHAKISGHYSSKQFFTNGQTVRQWLSTQSYQAQYDYGIKMLKQFGGTS